ncbi:MAG: DUF1540 domain-containing protein [Oscillospiraceae bacterium]|nr:DUF1540 domain-containing protein [Oscillospiraceae bacterium]
MNNEKQQKEVITGVNCEVMECKYHDGICNCSAPFINVRNKNYLLGLGTQCETFRQK